MNKKLLLTSIAIATLAGGAASTFAWGGHGGDHEMDHSSGHEGEGQGQGRGFGRTLTDEQRAQLQSMSPEERQAYVQNLRQQQGLPTQQNQSAMQQGGQFGGQGRGQGQMAQGQARQNMQEDPSAMISQYPMSNLTESEKEGLYNQYGEEKMAHDVYMYAYEKYDVQTFKNIANSEQKHMSAIKALLDRYGITPSSDYAADTELAKELMAKVDEGLEQALNVGVTIEEVDIKDIAKLAAEAAQNNAQDLLKVYTNIAGGSYNHLKGFLQALKNYGYTLPDVSEYLPSGVTVDQLLQMRGPDAKKLFVDYVKEHYGLDLSEYQNQCNQQNSNMQQRVNQTQANTTNNIQQRRGQMQNTQRPTTTMQNMNQVSTQVQAKVRNYLNQTKVQQYKALIEQKYDAVISKFTPEQLQEKIQKVDEVLAKIADSNYQETTKELYINVLVALKEALMEKLQAASSETDIINSVLGQ